MPVLYICAQHSVFIRDGIQPKTFTQVLYLSSDLRHNGISIICIYAFSPLHLSNKYCFISLRIFDSLSNQLLYIIHFFIPFVKTVYPHIW